MLKKIQKRLLENYPVLWNTKFVPMGITVLIFNIFFLINGFFSGSVNFHDMDYNYNITTVFYLISALASLLILIIWLLFYFKNNGLKSFYPKKSNALYIEWLLTFILLIGNQLYPYSYSQGIQLKERTYASKKQTYDAKKILNKIQILLPDSYYYYQSTPIKNTIDSLENDPDSTPMNLSLLNFNTYYFDQNKVEIEQVKNWLIKEQKDSIRNLIHKYLNLQKKHNLSSNLTVNSWMKLVYNPPNYFVPQSNYISKTKTYYDDNIKHYVEFQNLDFAYQKIYDAYNNGNFSNKFILVILYIALNLSILLFTYRTTSGKAWLIALVVLGLLTFINGIFSVVFQLFFIDNHFSHIICLINIYWSFVFLFMCVYILIKLYKKQAKNKSAIMINLILWMLPNIPILYFISFMLSMNESIYGEDQNTYISSMYHYFYDHFTVFFWINLIFVIIILFFIAKIIKKWRALPEE
ncbi:MAG: hypothetical protein J6581_06590 [Apibacter sp.]|nr:hypothetical protein [Apibacter sp.]